jgi:hypothetical protein
MVTIPDISASFIVKNNSNKSVRILGNFTLKPNASADLFTAVPNITEQMGRFA